MAIRVLRILAMALMVTGCSSVEPTPSADVHAPPPPSSAASPTAQATVIAEPSQIVEPTAHAGLAPDDVAQVVTTDLVVRSAPGTSTASEIYGPTLLSEPQLLYVVDGPVLASGYDWYLVVPFAVDWHPNNLPPPGWVAAASRDGEAWIAPAAPECGEPLLRDIVVELSRMARLACYSDMPLTLEGTFGGCHQGSDPGFSPSWLGAQGCLLYPYDYQQGVQIPDPGGLTMRFQGEIGVPYDQGGVAIRVDGHFDDPAALTCLSTELEPSLSPELVVFGCRTQFVATQVSIIGP